MKRSFTLFALCMCIALTLCAQTTKKVLFIGNSYVYTNDLPNMLKTLALGCGDTIEYSQSTPGGCTFNNHLSNSTTMGFISQPGWDYVILQEQSLLPSFPISQVQNECFPYAQQLCEKIRNTNPDAGIIFFMTWGRKNGDAGNCRYYEPLCTYEGMDSLLYWRYMEMAETNHTAVAPVGRVWHVLRDQHPEIELYSSDESHPSPAGTYAAALTFYTMIFQNSPSCVTNDLTLSTADAQAIRETVETVVFDSLDFWQAFVENVGVSDYAGETGDLKVFPNPAGETVQILCGANNPQGNLLVIHDIFGKMILKQKMSGDAISLDISSWPCGIYIVNADGKAVKFCVAR